MLGFHLLGTPETRQRPVVRDGSFWNIGVEHGLLRERRNHVEHSLFNEHMVGPQRRVIEKKHSPSIYR